MPRTFSDIVSDHSTVIPLLEKLIDKTTKSEEYANVLFELGFIIGSIISQKIKDNPSKISLACTVEDADYLGRGIIESLEKNGRQVLLTVYWNKRFTTGPENNHTAAPIIKEFHDDGYQEAHYLIVTKSIISSSCIVRTNLTKLINEFEPDRILVAAPVLLKGATVSLENEFAPSVSKKFEYLYFAEDDQKTSDGWVDPGIGGDIYQRLGFSDQAEKNQYIPTIVKERRARRIS